MMSKERTLFDQESKKNGENPVENNQCACKSSYGLYMQNRQLSWIVALIILVNFCLFMGGYFLGQKNVVSAFSNKIEQESFSDQIYSSMCSLCDNGEVEENAEEITDNDDQAPEQTEEQSQTAVRAPDANMAMAIDAGQIQSHSIVSSADADVDNDQQNDEEPENVNVADTQYYAQLIGFGSVRNAQQFAQKLSRKEIPVRSKKTSKSHGTWKICFVVSSSNRKI